MQEQKTNSGLSALRADLLKSHADGTFLETVYRCSLANHDERDDLALEVAALHNEGLVDVVAAFEELKAKAVNGPDFFLTRHVFERALPHIKADVAAVMRCVLRLYRDAGQDMAAGMILDSFIEFCAKDESRPREALALVEADSDQLADLLTAVIVSGSRIDNPRYVAAAVCLCENENIELRRRAVFALGRIQWPEGAAMTDAAFAAVERSIESENDDHILAVAVKSAFALWQKDKGRGQCAIKLIETALAKGDEYSIHAASEVFGFSTKELTPPLLEVLLTALMRVKPGNKGTLDNVDYGIDHLLNGQAPQRGIVFLEELLLTHHDDPSLPIFDSVIHTIASKPPLFGKFATRWLMKGDRVLCEGIRHVASKLHGAAITLSVDPAEVIPNDRTHVIFLGRKIIGYLLTSPLMAAGLIVSLMRHTDDPVTLQALKDLLLDPILLNYPDIADKFLAVEARKGSGPAETTLDSAIKSLDKYFEALRSVGTIPELHPNEEQREAHMRHFSRQVSESFKDAQKKSIFFGLVSKSYLLYGRKSINRVYGPGGEFRRMETALQNHSTTIEIPRMENIDPVGLDYMLRVFRVERFRR